ncbi:hypothetical protein [Achromobacter spanius]|uniref:Uncharacterized protein n=1 Tax=Achromobacter spanius TaxID=217203 RepID=A0A2S0IEU6_9BURK|nr:hypothetical protein [Achromobacter spanius]AVJ30287.1 hypothetical protein CLM73_26055 [Achromobacter spanius]
MPIATQDSWKHLPAPAQREPLHFQGRYTADEYARLRQGVIPQEMEDKWFIYLHDGWLRLHRSWTGNWIYALRLEQDGDAWTVTDSWVNRDPEQYRLTDAEYDRASLQRMLQWLMKGPAV